MLILSNAALSPPPVVSCKSCHPVRKISPSCPAFHRAEFVTNLLQNYPFGAVEAFHCWLVGHSYKAANLTSYENIVHNSKIPLQQFSILPFQLGDPQPLIDHKWLCGFALGARLRDFQYRQSGRPRQLDTKQFRNTEPHHRQRHGFTQHYGSRCSHWLHLHKQRKPLHGIEAQIHHCKYGGRLLCLL